MDQFRLANKIHIDTMKDFYAKYLKNKSTDCILYSNDGSQIKIQRELLGQTNFLREILSSTKDQCCKNLEIICPCTKEELTHLVNFLYNGEIHCKNENESFEIFENLKNIFGFTNNLCMEIQNKKSSDRGRYFAKNAWRGNNSVRAKFHHPSRISRNK